MLQDPSLQLTQLRPGLKPELINEAPAGRLEDVERICLTPGAIQGEHQSGDEPLAQRVRGDELLELGHELRPTPLAPATWRSAAASGVPPAADGATGATSHSAAV